MLKIFGLAFAGHVFGTLGNGAALKRKNSGDFSEVVRVEEEDVQVKKKVVKDNSHQSVTGLLLLSCWFVTLDDIGLWGAEKRAKTMHICLSCWDLVLF